MMLGRSGSGRCEARLVALLWRHAVAAAITDVGHKGKSRRQLSVVPVIVLAIATGATVCCHCPQGAAAGRTGRVAGHVPTHAAGLLGKGIAHAKHHGIRARARSRRTTGHVDAE